jgi:hypothetical protein
MQERLSSIHRSQFQQLAYMRSSVSPKVDCRPLLELTAGQEKEIRSLRRLPIPKFDALGRISDDRGWPQFTVRPKAYRNKHKARPLLPSMVARKFKISICVCPGRYDLRAHQYLSGAVSVFYSKETYETHLLECPFYTSPRQVRNLGVRFCSVGYFLSAAIMATISITTGSTSFSISPHLSINAAVPSDSPAFALFSYRNLDDDLNPRSTNGRRSESARSCEILDSTMQRLMRVFAERRASPTELNELGDLFSM